jgi:hypothetical protein
VDENFYRSLFPGTHRVLGRELLPLSFFHLLALRAVESPLLDPDGDVELPDLMVAVKICRSRFPSQPNLRPCFREKLLFLWRKDDRAFLARETEKFLAYKTAHEAFGPRFWENENEIVPRTLSAPAILARVVSLERRTNFTHQQIWNDIPPGYAAWLDGAIAEQEGAELRFEQPDDFAEDELPDLREAGAQELYEQAVRDLGREAADDWLARRNAYLAERAERRGE